MIIVQENTENISAPLRRGDTERVNELLIFDIKTRGIDKKILLQSGDVVEIDYTEQRAATVGSRRD